MGKLLKHPGTIAAIVIGLLGLAFVLYAWQLPPFGSTVRTTQNAYVRGQLTFVAPQVPGHVAKVEVTDYQTVTQGDVLVQLDDRSFVQKVQQAQATLATQQATLASAAQARASAEAGVTAADAQLEVARVNLRVAQQEWDRVEPLLAKGVVTQASGDTASAALQQAQASYHAADASLEIARQDVLAADTARGTAEAAIKSAEAAVRLAEIDLENTTITAPQDGRLGEIGARVGQYVTAGTQLMALVPQRIWVVANFKETQLYGMKRGQIATIEIDALNHRELVGHIEGFSPATGNEFSVLKTDNATGNFTKVAQRLSVRIAIDPDQAQADLLVPGLSAVVSIDVAQP